MSDLQLCGAKQLRKHKVGFIANKNLFFRETRKLINSYVVNSGLFEQPLKPKTALSALMQTIPFSYIHVLIRTYRTLPRLPVDRT
jgi:hypothetical protein